MTPVICKKVCYDRKHKIKQEHSVPGLPFKSGMSESLNVEKANRIFYNDRRNEWKMNFQEP
jgi:hypothetical protein